MNDAVQLIVKMMMMCACVYTCTPQVATPFWDPWLCVSSWAAGGSSPSLSVHPTQQTWLPTSPCHAWTMLSGKEQYLHVHIVSSE